MLAALSLPHFSGFSKRQFYTFATFKEILTKWFPTSAMLNISLPNGKCNSHSRKSVKISQSDSHQYLFQGFALSWFKERTKKLLFWK